MIITDLSENSEIIDSIYKIYTVNNVKECYCDIDTWKIKLNENTDIINPHIFFICEIHPTAVSHWVYESAVYLELFKLLKEKYVNIKLLIIGKKTFKTLFFNLFGISNEDVIYQDISPQENTYIIPYGNTANICIFPSPISSQLCKSINSAYSQQLIRLCNFFKKLDIENNYSIETLIMPRQKKENYVSNDRSIDLSHICDFFQKKNYNHSILNTDDITDLKQQIKLVRSSKYIILCDGAALALNLLFCSNKSFHIITRNSENQRQYYPMASLLIDTLCSFNNNKLVYFNDQDDFLRSITIPKN
jgi:hypothetical protein